ncbi:hypothetical protein ACIPK5_11620 [Streptomyces sp. NPDC086843]|uniref:hypothetical protein n=1 Tax=Streptomyces sp. NPDC086843 TaxID=3365763 RepID=UPI0037F31225
MREAVLLVPAVADVDLQGRPAVAEVRGPGTQQPAEGPRVQQPSCGGEGEFGGEVMLRAGTGGR